jgi:multidrug transporter EmrE-like cation transporter
MPITVEWSHIGLGSVIAFLIGWFIFGPLGAIAIAIVVLILMGVIKIR